MSQSLNDGDSSCPLPGGFLQLFRMLPPFSLLTEDFEAGKVKK